MINKHHNVNEIYKHLDGKINLIYFYVINRIKIIRFGGSKKVKLCFVISTFLKLTKGTC